MAGKIENTKKRTIKGRYIKLGLNGTSGTADNKNSDHQPLNPTSCILRTNAAKNENIHTMMIENIKVIITLFESLVIIRVELYSAIGTIIDPNNNNVANTD